MEFFVETTNDLRVLKQGDLLEGVPFVYFAGGEAQVPVADGTPETVNLFSANESTADFLVARYERSWGVVLNQSCDLELRDGAPTKPILVSRVKPAEEHHECFGSSGTPKARYNKVRELANPTRAPNRFYLPAFAGEFVQTGRLIADLADVQRFVPSDYHDLLRSCRLRLASEPLRALQARFAYFSGRLAVDDELFFSDDEIAIHRRR